MKRIWYKPNHAAAHNCDEPVYLWNFPNRDVSESSTFPDSYCRCLDLFEVSYWNRTLRERRTPKNMSTPPRDTVAASEPGQNLMVGKSKHGKRHTQHKPRQTSGPVDRWFTSFWVQ